MSAGVFPSGTASYWSGTFADGSFARPNGSYPENWTGPLSDSMWMMTGKPDSTEAPWISHAAISALAKNPLLGIAW